MPIPLRRGGLLLALVVLLLVRIGAAEEPLRTAADRPIDIEHIRLELALDLAEKHVDGQATIRFIPLRQLETVQLDAVDHQVESIVLLDEQSRPRRPLKFENTGTRLLIHFGQPLPRAEAVRIAIKYQLDEPKTGLHFFGPSKAEPEVPLMVWSQGEPISNRYWFPCADNPNERQTTEIIATVDEEFTALSNGRLIDEQKLPDGRRRFHWKQEKPHVAYLVTLVAGRFEIGREEWRGKPVTYYVMSDRAADTQRTFGRTLEMLDYFSERFGIEYPWEKYAQVVVEQFTSGGMENTSATTLYQRVMHDQRALLDSTPDRLIAHELGHQWWGDLVTCKDWSHLWLNEGFATYCEVLWNEHKLGRDERDLMLYEKSASARSGAALTRPIVDRHYSSPRIMFDARAYPKGGWVLHMLRSRVGDEDFFRALKRYGILYSYQTAETADLRQTFERLLGRSLERFFYDWTERAGHPELTIKSSYEADSKLMRIAIQQTQKSDAFEFPLRIDLVPEGTSAAVETVTVEKIVNEKELTWYVPMPTRPKLVRVDPEFTLLAAVKEQKSRDLWVEQLSAPTVAERIRAVEHFGASKSTADRKLLIESLNDDAFHGVQQAAAKALGKSGGDVSRDALIAALGHPHPKVRREVVSALAGFAEDSQVAAALETRLKQGDASYFVEAELLTSLTKVQREPALEPLLAGLEEPSHSEVIRQAALRGLARSTDPRAFETLLEWTRRGHPRVCRTTAMASLADFFERNEVSKARQTQAVEALIGYSQNDGPHQRRAAVNALRDMSLVAKPAVDVLTSLAEHDPDERVRLAAKSAVEKVQTDTPPSSELRNLRSEVERLRKKNTDLIDRLDKLEAK